MKQIAFFALTLLFCSSSNAQELAPYSPSGPGQLVVAKCFGNPCLKRDGVGPYRPKGLIVLGLATAASSRPLLTPTFRKIEQDYSINTLLAIRAFGADSVRFNVSQVNLDPQSSYFDATYSGQIVSNVQQARALKLTVLVEINDEQPPNTARLGMPSDATVRAWQRLAPLFASDQGIMLGAYNEPTNVGISSSDLVAWQAGYNNVVAQIRGAGAKNVIVIDGLHFAGQLPAAALSYLITDSAHNLVYGIHPFPRGKLAFPAGWPDAFQRFCAPANGVLCQITAWNMFGSVSNGIAHSICPHENPQQSQMPAISQRLLDAAKSMNSGVYGWAFDYPDVIMDSRDPLSKTVSFDNFVDCRRTPTPWGGGELLRRNFKDPKW
jgi:hypothetical protein